MLKKIIFFNLIFSTFITQISKSAESGGMPQLNPEFWISQIFWLIISFGILFIVLSKFILPKIRNNIEFRKSEILDNIETAEKQKTEAENTLKKRTNMNKENIRLKYGLPLLPAVSLIIFDIKL